MKWFYLSCDICWETVDHFDIDAEFESKDLVICSKCRSDYGEDSLFEKF